MALQVKDDAALRHRQPHTIESASNYKSNLIMTFQPQLRFFLSPPVRKLHRLFTEDSIRHTMPCTPLSALESRSLESTNTTSLSGSTRITHDGCIILLAITGALLLFALLAYSIRAYKTRVVEIPHSGRASPTLKSFLHGREMYSPKMDDMLGSVSPPSLLFGTGAFALKDPVIENCRTDTVPHSLHMRNETGAHDALGSAADTENSESSTDSTSPVPVITIHMDGE